MTVMQILTIDVGTGTQDIYLFRSGVALENGFKLVMPSPTMMVRKQIKESTQKKAGILLTGVMMGGGPCHWAAEEHLRAGLPLYATPDSARTFNDDLEWVQREMGIRLVSQDETRRLKDVDVIQMRDFDYSSIVEAFHSFGFDLDPDVVAVAVFDHGAAPPDISDRQFRFDYLEERIRSENRLMAFAYHANDIPKIMTRMQAVVQTADEVECPMILMDTAPAAVIGATLDPEVSQAERLIIVNVGNFHTLAFKLSLSGIEGVFEHHTGLIDRQYLEQLLVALAYGTLTHEQVFGDQGHGALIINPAPLRLDTRETGVVVTGPRRSMMKGSALRPYFAVPFGDMMLAGCFGLLVAVADLLPEVSEPIHDAIEGATASTTPWDAEK
jgi:uncharacterized protein (DUF1786 family)